MLLTINIRTIKTSIIIIALTLYYTNVNSQPNYQWDWVKTKGSSLNDYVRSIASDNQGNYIVCGTFNSNVLTLGNTVQLNSNGSETYFVAKYDSLGNALWAKKAICSASGANKVVLDTVGNIYVAGYVINDSNHYGVDFSNLHYNFRSTASVLVKYSSSGIEQWAVIADENNGSTQANCLKYDIYDNSLVMAGWFTGDTLRISGSGIVSNITNYLSQNKDIYLSKIAFNGIVSWIKRIGGNNNDAPTDLIIEETSTHAVLFTASMTSNKINFTTTDSIVGSSSNNMDGFLAKYDASGTFQWARKGTSGGVDNFNALAYLNSQYVVGINTDSTYTINTTTLSTGNYLFYLDSNGNLTNFQAFPARINILDVIKSTPTANAKLLIGGTFQSSQFTLGNFVLYNHDSTNQTNDVYVAMMSNSSTYDFALSAGSISNDEITGITSVNSKILSCGNYLSYPIYFDSIPYGNNGGSDFFIAKIGVTNPPPPIYYNMGGTVFANQIPIDAGIAILYNLLTLMPVDTAIIDTMGYYDFFHIASGSYSVKAELSTSSSSLGQYAPTYFSNQLNWSSADTINLNANSWYGDIHLQSLNSQTSGNGTIHGNIGTNPVNLLSGIEVLLFNMQDQLLAYTNTDVNGVYQFSNLAYGTYKIWPEIFGKTTTPAIITLSANNPISQNVDFIIDSSTVHILMGIDEENNSTKLIGNIYPVPASSQLHIEINSSKTETYQLKIFNLMGKEMRNTSFKSNATNQSLSIDITDFPASVYKLIIQTKDKALMSRNFAVIH
ncbi:MAG: T9SS type A sorting domain-containing protein [Bacteroidota bacterium]